MKVRRFAVVGAAVAIMSAAAGATLAYWSQATTLTEQVTTAAVSFRVTKGLPNGSVPATGSVVSSGGPVTVRYGIDEATALQANGSAVAIPFKVEGSYRGWKGLRYSVQLPPLLADGPLSASVRHFFPVASPAACTPAAVPADGSGVALNDIVLDTGSSYDPDGLYVHYWCLVFNEFVATTEYTNVGLVTASYNGSQVSDADSWSAVVDPGWGPGSTPDSEVRFVPVTFRA